MNRDIILSELKFKTSRSSGPGGQHVNKTESRVTVEFFILSSNGLTDFERMLLLENLSYRITKEGYLQISCSNSRSQTKNKEECIRKLMDLIAKNIVVKKKRLKTTISKAAKQKRLDNKKRRSKLKKLRGKDYFDE